MPICRFVWQPFLALADLPPTNDAGLAIALACTRIESVADRWIGDALVAAAATQQCCVLTRDCVARKSSRQLSSISIKVVAEHHARSGDASSVPALVLQLRDAQPKVAAAIVEGHGAGLAR